MSVFSTGTDVRAACRSGEWTKPTPGQAAGYVQANLVIVPREFAFDFLLFCHRNPKPCPLLDVTEPGDPEPRGVAPKADLRTDLPLYRVWKNGELADEPRDIASHWRDDLVSFLIGCSFTFEAAMQTAGLPVRHIEQGVNVPMYRTTIPCLPAGRFSGSMVVSMRPLTPRQAVAATGICARYPKAHGVPVHFGNGQEIGIRDVGQPEFGDPVEIRSGEQPVYWACGVTPQVALMNAKLPFAITHSPGHMFVTDWKDVQLEQQ